MKSRNVLTACLSLLIIAGAAIPALADEDAKDKNITLISAQSSADGKSMVRKELLEECIVSLPGQESLEAEVTSSSQYLKGINGDNSRNKFVKTYKASLGINYMLRQKELIIVTTSSVQGQEPVMKVFERNIMQSKVFRSNPTEGDLYAGRSKRQYYFSTAEGAVNDVKKRAATWLKQKSAVVCRDK
ncbi:hypothetical protein ACFL5V_03705 [Fibrobacterota bacterium]